MNSANAVKPSASLYLGVDGGGTKTQVLLGCIRDGLLTVLAAGQGGPSNPRAIGFDAAFQNIDHAIQSAFNAANLDRCCADQIVLCLAGAGRQEEKSAVEDWIIHTGIAQRARVVSEAEAVIEASLLKNENQSAVTDFPDDADTEIALICGTGSLAWGRKKSDHNCFARSSGWGYLLGDEGSGFWIGQKILNAACKAADGRAADSELLEAVLKHLDLDSPSQLISWCYQDAASRQRIASVAPLVFQLTEQAGQGTGSSPLAGIIAQAAADLAAMIAAVAHQLDSARFDLATAGSVIIHQPGLLQLVVQRLSEQGLQPRRVNQVHQPAQGCLKLATA